MISQRSRSLPYANLGNHAVGHVWLARGYIPVLAVILGICLIGCSGENHPIRTPQPSQTPTQASGQPASSTAMPTPNVASFDDGTELVGKEIEPGTYRTRSDPSGECYWARLSDASGKGQDVLAHQTIDGPAIVTISSSDAAFMSTGCGQWTDDLSPVSSEDSGQDRDSPDDPFSDGTYFVESEIDPGIWQASATSGCSWSRLAGFSGDSSETIESAQEVSAPTVTVSAADAGFSSSHCGVWTKLHCLPGLGTSDSCPVTTEP